MKLTCQSNMFNQWAVSFETDTFCASLQQYRFCRLQKAMTNYLQKHHKQSTKVGLMLCPEEDMPLTADIIQSRAGWFGSRSLLWTLTIVWLSSTHSESNGSPLNSSVARVSQTAKTSWGLLVCSEKDMQPTC
ncbi:hypothetical protein BsWGS_11129 [Bradybaena similaris]